jgi:adenylate kinase family enzyme
MLITLFGPPAAGKSTVGDRLHRERGFQHLALGRMIRTGELSSIVGLDQAQMDARVAAGKPVSDPALFIWLNSLIGGSERRFVVDGYPREPDALAPFNDLVKTLPRTRRAIALHLTAPFEVAAARIVSRGRGDDTAKLAKNRYLEYVNVQVPLLARLHPRVVVHEIEAGSVSSADVWREVLAHVPELDTKDE